MTTARSVLADLASFTDLDLPTCRLVTQLEDALLAALPFVEDAEKDPAFKPTVRKILEKIRDALAAAQSEEVEATDENDDVCRVPRNEAAKRPT